MTANCLGFDAASLFGLDDDDDDDEKSTGAGRGAVVFLAFKEELLCSGEALTSVLGYCRSGGGEDDSCLCCLCTCFGGEEDGTRAFTRTTGSGSGDGLGGGEGEGSFFALIFGCGGDGGEGIGINGLRADSFGALTGEGALTFEAGAEAAAAGRF